MYFKRTNDLYLKFDHRFVRETIGNELLLYNNKIYLYIEIYLREIILNSFIQRIW